MKVQLLCLLLLFCFNCSVIFAQETHVFYDDVFQLSDNSIFVGNDSLVTLYYPDGSKKAHGKFALDKEGHLSPFKVGKWSYYNSKGSIQSQGNYQMSSFIDCGTGGPQRAFYHYKIGHWAFFDKDENVIAEGNFNVEEFPIKTRCGSERIHFGITDSTWSFNKFNGISLQEIETVEIVHQNYSEKIFFDRKDEWIKVDIDH
jgi:antitoxin component YwqK of YwqJK toxin-antitoxin module